METDISLERAQTLIIANLSRMTEEAVTVSEAVGRVLSRKIYCEQSLPAWPQSAVDGFALGTGSTDNDSIYQLIIGENELALSPGQAVRVLTGGKLPGGVQAVVPHERTRLDNEQLTILEQVKNQQNIKQSGEDFKAGELLLESNSRLDWGAAAILAACGIQPVWVQKRPRAAILALGPDIVPYYADIAGGYTRDCNSPLLTALVSRDGGTVTETQIGGAGDNITALLMQCIESSDMVILTGGTYRQGYSEAQSLMESVGAQLLYWGVPVQPGSHNGAGIYGKCLILALSGNPAACAVGYHLFAAPALRAMQGINPNSPVIKAKCIEGFDKKSGTRRFVRGQARITNQGWEVSIQPGQKPSMVRSLLNCNALIDFLAGSTPLAAGQEVNVVLLENSSLIPETDIETKPIR